MIPIRDDNPTRRFPIVTILFIATNIFVFFAIGSGEAEIFHYGFIPCDLLGQCEPLSNALDESFGGRSSVFSLLSAMFMHADILHLGGNMLFLWVFGNNVEETLGRFKFLVFYLLCGVLATGAYVVLNSASSVPLIGASGAVSGVLGAYLWIFPRARVTALVPFFLFLPVNVSARFVLVVWFVLQLVEGLAGGGATPEGGGIAISAHIGGFIAGYVIARLLTERQVPGRVAS